MELNGTTLILEIVNFLILVWLLKHFFYTPVLTFLDNRKHQVEHSLQQAEQRHREAEKLEDDYKEKLSEWQKEKQQEKEKLNQELQSQQQQALEQLQKQLTVERAKSDAINKNRQLDWMKQQQRQSHRQATRFVSSMLSAMSGPELEHLLIEQAIAQLKELPDEQKSAFVSALQDSNVELKVISHFPLSRSHSQALQFLLEGWSKTDLTVNFEQDETLLSGLLIEAGAWILKLNLRDELQSFSELAYESMDGTTA